MARGEGFSENPGATTKSESRTTTQSAERSSGQSAGGGENTSNTLPAETTGNLQSATSEIGASGGQGRGAPTYIASQYLTDTAGPHGKNLKEGIDYKGTEGGIQKAMNAEPGSEDDPARLAAMQFRHNQLRGMAGTGDEQNEVGDDTVYETLERNEPA